ncbi:MAG: hypothetical protein JXX28_02810 [Deltaproteobacteria bacterium]|nr:hypothetical protein [Deltaproteobacteria bacterium]
MMQRALLTLSLLSLLTGCVSDEDSAVEDTGVLPEAGDSPCQDEAAPDIGHATELSASLHDEAWFFVDMEAMMVGYQADAPYTWMMQKAPPVPPISLGEGVEVVNLGPVGFHEVDLGPAEGWVRSGTFDTDWQAGGQGSTGFVMSGNVYALRTPEGRYGKVEILSAQAGEVRWLAYLQEDADSCNLRTQE